MLIEGLCAATVVKFVIPMLGILQVMVGKGCPYAAQVSVSRPPEVCSGCTGAITMVAGSITVENEKLQDGMRGYHTFNVLARRVFSLLSP